MSATLLWFRRDLRLSDHPALLAAGEGGGPVVPVFVLDDALRAPAGAPRLAFLYRSLRQLSEATGGALRVLHGRPEDVVPDLARRIGVEQVHISADFGPYGRERDQRVREALGGDGRELVATGSPYAVAPGRIRKPDHEPYAVYTPFYRAWRKHGWRAPAAGPAPAFDDGGIREDGVPADPELSGTELPPAGEEAAQDRWHVFRDEYLGSYADRRDRPDLTGTSRLSVYLKYGLLHPRTLLADLGDGPGPESFRSELAWREFYADVLYHHPESARAALRPELSGIRLDEGPTADARFRAWTQGRTGFPFVDAGMRQLLAEGWMHNRVRMVVASFLVKDCHVDWTRGSRYFLQHLVDGDVASNNHGWQWVAGTGTDAAPYFRVFNPVTQGEKFDPHGSYIRRYVPELAELTGKAVHQPWTLPHQPTGYPERIVDHAAERQEALDRYQAVRN